MSIELISIAISIGISLLTAGGLIGGWIRQASKISLRSEANREAVVAAARDADDARQAADAVGKEVTQLELRMIRDFAQHEHLKEVEQRLVEAIRELTTEFRELRRALTKHTSDE